MAPASVLQGLRDEYYGTEEKLSLALGEALRTEYKAITDAGLIVQLDDAWLAAKYDVMVPPASLCRLLRLGGTEGCGAQPRPRRNPARAKPIPRVLGKLERTAHQRRIG